MTLPTDPRNHRQQKGGKHNQRMQEILMDTNWTTHEIQHSTRQMDTKRFLRLFHHQPQPSSYQQLQHSTIRIPHGTAPCTRWKRTIHYIGPIHKLTITIHHSRPKVPHPIPEHDGPMTIILDQQVIPTHNREATQFLRYYRAQRNFRQRRHPLSPNAHRMERRTQQMETHHQTEKPHRLPHPATLRMQLLHRQNLHHFVTVCTKLQPTTSTPPHHQALLLHHV